MVWRHHGLTTCGLLYMMRVLAECCIVGQTGRPQWCHRLWLEVVKWDRAAIDVQQQTDSCCPPERQQDTFWKAAWCINSVFSTNVKLSTLCASLLMEHHVLSPTYRPLVSVSLNFFLCVFLLFFIWTPFRRRSLFAFFTLLPSCLWTDYLLAFYINPW